jgi:hypothetical protein
LSDRDTVVVQIVYDVCRSEKGIAEEDGSITSGINTKTACLLAIGESYGIAPLIGERKDKFVDRNFNDWTACSTEAKVEGTLNICKGTWDYHAKISVGGGTKLLENHLSDGGGQIRQTGTGIENCSHSEIGWC